VDQHHLGHVVRGRHHVVGQRSGQQLALRIVGYVLEQDAAELLRGAAGNLALNQQKVILCVFDAVDGPAVRRGQSRD
jgi:hypothetical protein